MTHWYCAWHVFPRLSSGRQPSDGLWARSASERRSERTALYVPRALCTCVHRGHLWLCSRSSPVILAPHVRRKFREVKPPAQRHTAGEWLSQDEPWTSDRVATPSSAPLLLGSVGSQSPLAALSPHSPLEKMRTGSSVVFLALWPLPSPPLPRRFGEG